MLGLLQVPDGNNKTLSVCPTGQSTGRERMLKWKCTGQQSGNENLNSFSNISIDETLKKKNLRLGYIIKNNVFGTARTGTLESYQKTCKKNPTKDFEF